MLTEPVAGDWFCFPQSVVCMDKHAPPTKEHRWIVAAAKWPNDLEYPCVLRSTQDWQQSDILHPPHQGSCRGVACRINKKGWIRRDAMQFILQRHFTPDRKSCKEPDEEVIEQVMKLAEDSYKRQREGNARRRRRR